MYTVAILMSTFNGERFLKEQIDSILNQRDVNVELYIRDDGSTDKTQDIIFAYSDEYNNIHLQEGSNIGVGCSFMSLVAWAGLSADFFAFADQDDIWLKDKVINAINTITGINRPCCYCCNQTLVNQNLEVISRRHDVPVDVSYLQILCDNQISGCTMVWNKELQALLSDVNRLPSAELMKKRIHDVWVSMVAAVTGVIIYDKNSYIYYRQHDNNVVGVKKTSVFAVWKKKLFDSSLRNGRSDLAHEILYRFSDVIADIGTKETLRYISEYRNNRDAKKQLLSDRHLQTISNETSIGYKAKVLCNLF